MIMNVSREQAIEAIKLHWRVQLGSYFDQVHDLGGAVYNLGKEVEDYFWNYAGMVSVKGSDIGALVAKVEKFAREHNRVPAFFVEPTTNPSSFEGSLDTLKYERGDDEIWMHINRTPADKTSLLNIKRVATNSDMTLFVEIFHQAFGMLEGDQTTTPYGDALYRAFRNPPANVEILHFIGYAGNEAITVASTYVSGDGAGLYNVGTRPNHLRKGYAAEISIHALSEAFEKGVRQVILQTELGGDAERLYKRLGFLQTFSGVFWSKSQ